METREGPGNGRRTYDDKYGKTQLLIPLAIGSRSA